MVDTLCLPVPQIPGKQEEATGLVEEKERKRQEDLAAKKTVFCTVQPVLKLK